MTILKLINVTLSEKWVLNIFEKSVYFYKKALNNV